MNILRDSMSQFSLEARILAVYRARSRKNFFFLFIFFPKEEEKLQEMIQNEEVGGKKKKSLFYLENI